ADPHRTRVAVLRRLAVAFPARVGIPVRIPARGADRRGRDDRSRRLRDPRSRRGISRRAGLRRGGDPLRRPRSVPSLGGAPALRRGRALSPARRAPPDGHASVSGSAVVVGAGVFGAATGRELAHRGWDVRVIEQDTAGNVRSGSGGDTRLLRFSHGDAEWYTLLARRALELWRGVEAETGVQ